MWLFWRLSLSYFISNVYFAFVEKVFLLFCWLSLFFLFFFFFKILLKNKKKLRRSKIPFFFPRHKFLTKNKKKNKEKKSKKNKKKYKEKQRKKEKERKEKGFDFSNLSKKGGCGNYFFCMENPYEKKVDTLFFS